MVFVEKMRIALRKAVLAAYEYELCAKKFLKLGINDEQTRERPILNAAASRPAGRAGGRFCGNCSTQEKSEILAAKSVNIINS